MTKENLRKGIGPQWRHWLWRPWVVKESWWRAELWMRFRGKTENLEEAVHTQFFHFCLKTGIILSYECACWIQEISGKLWWFSLLFPEVNIEEQLRSDFLEGALGLFSSMCGTNVMSIIREHVWDSESQALGQIHGARILHFQRIPHVIQGTLKSKKDHLREVGLLLLLSFS